VVALTLLRRQDQRGGLVQSRSKIGDGYGDSNRRRPGSARRPPGETHDRESQTSNRRGRQPD
jgi:hypothetical protein